jgi:hypothetical protein
MRGQTIQFNGERDATAILASLEDDVSIDALTWGGRTMPVFLAADHAEQRHLMGDNVVRVVIGAEPYDVEAHTLSLRFPSAEEAARFRTKVLAGTFIIGTLAVPTAIGIAQLTSQTSAAPVLAPVQVPAAPMVERSVPIVVQRAAPVVDAPEEPGFTLQSKGTSEATGEDNQTGSSIMWIHNRNDDAR